jgi:hypothetical protein
MVATQGKDVPVGIGAVGLLDMGPDKIRLDARHLYAEFRRLAAEFFPVRQPGATFAGLLTCSIDVFDLRSHVPSFPVAGITRRMMRTRMNAVG